MIVHVNTADFRRALQAVIPHAHDDTSTGLAVVHFAATADHVYVQASNGTTAGMAIASVWDHQDLTGDPDEDSFDLTVDAAKELLQVFRPKKKPENELDDQLSIQVDIAKISVLDVSGLFPGKAWTIPNTATSENFPNLPRMFNDAMTGRPRVPEQIVASGKLLKLFSAASAAYKDALALEPTTRPQMMLISCSESFLGALMQVRVEEDSDLARELKDHRAGWQNRLPMMALAITRGRDENQKNGEAA
ncbi:hypothetical protein [Nesterenkonia sp. K-15-9-6]|uniref:hypothetical protein n=1 Tax=Nesterenkonia sp. K-15-9-6 TaxID=3093918 RepID=UPI0040444304